MKRDSKNYLIYTLMMLIFGVLIYTALWAGKHFDTFSEAHKIGQNVKAFQMFKQIIIDNLNSSITTLIIQIIVILIAVRIFSFLFKRIGQPGVIGEIVAGIVLGPSLLGHFFPNAFLALFPEHSLTNLNLLSQIGLVLFMFVIGMELDFSVLRKKMNETLVISHAGIVVPFFLGILTSFWVYEEYASQHTAFIPFSLFIGISMSITAFPVLARIVQERNMTKSPIGTLTIASAANDDVTAWCLLAVVIAIAKAGSFVSALFTIGLAFIYILFMFQVVRPFLKKIGNVYASSEVINKTFVGFIFLILLISSVITEIIGIHALFGAFMAGVIMPSNIGFRKVMMDKVEDIALVFFLPLFFAFTGLRTQIGLLNTPELWCICILLIIVAVTGKLGGCAIAARMVGETWKDSLIVGTLMNTRGLMELIALNIGYEMGILPPSIFVMLIIMALSTTFMTTPLLHWVERYFSLQAKKRYSGEKILLSFGLPESGRNLLIMASVLFGKQLRKTEIIASHFTIGTDLNPIKAEQYQKESFIPLKKQASRMKLKIHPHYKITDKLEQEIIHQVDDEKIKFLFIGAGLQFLQTPPISVHNEYFPKINNFYRLLKQKTYQLPGNLMKDKTEPIFSRIDCSIGILVNRGLTKPENIFIILNGTKDAFLFFYMESILKNSRRNINISRFEQTTDKNIWKNPILLTLMSSYPNRINVCMPVEENIQMYEKNSLTIIGYETCMEASEKSDHFRKLSSLLVIREKKTDNSTENENIE